MTDYLDILIVLLVVAWLWTRFKKKNIAKQHEQDNRPDESPPAVVVQEDDNAEPAAADVDVDVDVDVDYLQLALEKGREAKVAMREKNNAEAWELLQQQKSFYNKFSINEGSNESELIALDSSVSKDLANLLRQDKKHKDALVHIIYWVANSKTVTKDQESKLRVYFNRAKLMGPAVDDVMDYCLGDEGKELHVVQKDVDSWV
jgi:predicted DNA binding protein